jgi:hypothetical protein
MCRKRLPGKQEVVVNVRAGWLTGLVLSLALAAAGCDDGLTNSFTNQRGSNGPGGVGNDTTAQNSSTVQGTVTSPNGGLGGVSVILVGRDSTLTDGTGAYRFTRIPAGTYSVSVRVPIGFTLAAGQNSTQTLTVANAATATANWQMTQQTASP